MLGNITIQYNDLNTSESREESFESVESVSLAGHPDGIGDSIILTHTDDRENTVRSGVALTGVE